MLRVLRENFVTFVLTPGRNDRAVTLFRESYQLAPYPALLFNIARCEEQLRHFHAAREAYERYLTVNPEDAEARARAGELRQRELEEHVTEPSPLPSPEAVAPVVIAAPPVAAAPRTPVYKKWWLWTAVVGVAAVAVGVGLGVGLSGADPQRTFPPLGAR